MEFAELMAILLETESDIYELIDTQLTKQNKDFIVRYHFGKLRRIISKIFQEYAEIGITISLIETYSVDFHELQKEKWAFNFSL